VNTASGPTQTVSSYFGYLGQSGLVMLTRAISGCDPKLTSTGSTSRNAPAPAAPCRRYQRPIQKA
jgi:hypothetical protein